MFLCAGYMITQALEMCLFFLQALGTKAYTPILIRPSIIVLGDRLYASDPPSDRSGTAISAWERPSTTHSTSRPSSSPSRPLAQDKPRMNPTPSRLHNLPTFLFLFPLNFFHYSDNDDQLSRRHAAPVPPLTTILSLFTGFFYNFPVRPAQQRYVYPLSLDTALSYH